METVSLRQLWCDEGCEIIFLSQSDASFVIEASLPSFKKEFTVPKKEMMLLQAGHYRLLKFAASFNAYKVDWSMHGSRDDDELWSLIREENLVESRKVMKHNKQYDVEHGKVPYSPKWDHPSQDSSESK